MLSNMINLAPAQLLMRDVRLSEIWFGRGRALAL